MNNSVEDILPSTVKFVFITKPLFGEIIAVAEPDFILSKSPNALAFKLNKPAPSPLNKDAVIEPLIFVFPAISKVVLENGPILST